MNNNILEKRKVNEEYQIWETNSPYLYEFVIKHNLEWPSLMVEWFPNRPSNSDALGLKEENNLLLGTHTTGERNYLIVASANLQKDEIKKDDEVSRKKQKINNDYNSFSGNEDKIGSIDIKKKIPHKGEVHRARPMPQNPNVVASRGPDPELYIWNLESHTSSSTENNKKDIILPLSPLGLCIGHTDDGYGLCWNPHKIGCLVTASHDTNVCLWDVNNTVKSTLLPSIQPICKYSGHTDAVEDVDWHYLNPNIFGSVADDRTIRIWDARDTKIPIHLIKDAHMDDIHAISFHHSNEYMFATGSADKLVSLWDLRNLNSQTQTLFGHTDQIYSVAWSPFKDSILASCSTDRRVALWDLSCIGNEQTDEDAEDGPPELLFLHSGHTSKVLDFSWNYSKENEWTIASVAEDNTLQVWMLSDDIIGDLEEGDSEEYVEISDDSEE